LKINKNLI